MAAQLITLRIHMGGMAGIQMGQNGVRTRRPSSRPASGVSGPDSGSAGERVSSTASVRRGLSARGNVKDSTKLSVSSSAAPIRRGLSVRESGGGKLIAQVSGGLSVRERGQRLSVNESLLSRSPSADKKAGSGGGDTAAADDTNSGGGSVVKPSTSKQTVNGNGEGPEVRSLESAAGKTTGTLDPQQGDSSTSRASAPEGTLCYSG